MLALLNFQIYIHFCFLQYSIGFHVRKKQIFFIADDCPLCSKKVYKVYKGIQGIHYIFEVRGRQSQNLE